MEQLWEVVVMFSLDRKDREFKAARGGQLAREHKKIDLDNVRAMKIIEGKDPKYAKHMFLRNQLLENFAMRATGGIDILDQPVCRSCEKPAAWHTGGTAYCFSCGTTTKEPITVQQYLIEHTKYFTDEQIELMVRAGEME